MSIIKICGLTLIIYKVISLSKQQFLTINYQYTAHVHKLKESFGCSNLRLGSAVQVSAKAAVIIVPIGRLKFSESRIIRTVIHVFHIARGRWYAGTIGMRLNGTCHALPSG